MSATKPVRNSFERGHLQEVARQTQG